MNSSSWPSSRGDFPRGQPRVRPFFLALSRARDGNPGEALPGPAEASFFALQSVENLRLPALPVRAALLLLAWNASTAGAVQAEPSGADESNAVELRGRAVCVDDTGGRQECAAEGNRFALVTADGTLHWFARHDSLAPLYR